MVYIKWTLISVHVLYVGLGENMLFKVQASKNGDLQLQKREILFKIANLMLKRDFLYIKRNVQILTRMHNFLTKFEIFCLFCHVMSCFKKKFSKKKA